MHSVLQLHALFVFYVLDNSRQSLFRDKNTIIKYIEIKICTRNKNQVKYYLCSFKEIS